jgi:hypothetical protein
MRRVAGILVVAAFALPGAVVAHEGRHPIRIEAPKGTKAVKVNPAQRRWLSGDHHVHSQYSVGFKPAADPTQPPTPIVGGDAIYPIPKNAEMGAKFGLSWMVATDHGGPNHSKVNRDLAYPELLESRRRVKSVIQFYGLELNSPGADHSSIIVPKTPAERDVLFDLESRFDKREAWPIDPTHDAEARMIQALKVMRDLPAPPLVIAHHPSRSARGISQYGMTTPRELRAWNDAAPKVAIGMEGAPGHQAGTLNTSGVADPDDGFRGSYRAAPTMGGFDQMTARLGGFWDSMLGEGRRWWITATSDSHRHYTEGGSDFWPGEYSKTYVKAARDPADILDGLREGRVFVTLGDLVSELDVTLQATGAKANLGETLTVPRGADVTVVIRLRDPAGANHGGQTPDVARVDVIRSEIGAAVPDPTIDANPRARVERRFGPRDWVREGERISMTLTLKNVTEATYIRVRGTNGAELEPTPDTAGEDPWTDLWFYANPVFIAVR